MVLKGKNETALIFYLILVTNFLKLFHRFEIL